MKKPETFDAFCRACLDVLKAGRTRHLIVGGIAVTAVGEPRFTADLDVIVFLRIEQLDHVAPGLRSRRGPCDLGAVAELRHEAGLVTEGISSADPPHVAQ